jgi:O-antigen/teichoic acid export membrane protein
MVRGMLHRVTRVDRESREVILGSGIAFLIKIMAAAAAFGMTVALTRILGAAESGLFFLAYTIVIIAATVSRIGLDQTLIRMIAAAHQEQNWARVNAVFTTAGKWILLSSLVVTCFIWATASSLERWVFHQPGFAAVMQALSLGVVLMALFSFHAYALQGLRRIATSLFVLSVAAPLSVLGLVVVWPPADAFEAAGLYLVGAAVALVTGVLGWVMSRKRAGYRSAPDVKEMLRSCRPLFTATVLVLVVNWFPQLLVGAFGSSADVAVFNAAHRTALLTSFVLVAVNSTVAPRFAQLYQDGRLQDLAKMAKAATRLMVLLALPGLVIMLLWPAQVLAVFGDGFGEGGAVLQILALSQFVNVATGSVGYLLSMSGNERLLRNSVAFAAIVCILGSAVLVPCCGILGAAVAAAAGVIIQNLICVRYCRKVMGIDTLSIWR